MNQKLIDMLELQKKLNLIVGKRANGKIKNWKRCAVGELFEAQDHIGYKFWKRSEPNIVQFEIEIIDVFHFYLSEILRLDYHKSLLDLIKQLDKMVYNKPLIKRVLDYPTDENIEAVLSLIDRAISKYSNGDLSDGAMMGCLLYDCLNHDGDVIKRLSDLYIPKNALNLYRNTNGYLDGTYPKVIDGREDNRSLETILSEDHGYDIDYILKRLSELHPVK